MEPVHPQFVHLPLALSALLPLLGGILTLAWWRGWLVRRVWLIVMLLHATLTISAFAAMQTGETDERVVQKIVHQDLIRDHEETAELFLWSTVVSLFLALIATVAEEERIALRYAVYTVLVSIGSLYLAIDAGNQGGHLVYKYGASRAFIPVDYGGAPQQPHEGTLKKIRSDQEKLSP